MASHETPRVYPLIPPPPSSSRSHTFQPSAPPSAPTAHSPAASAPPSAPPSAPALYAVYPPLSPPCSTQPAVSATPSNLVQSGQETSWRSTPPLQQSWSHQEPWHASSLTPTETDLQSEHIQDDDAAALTSSDNDTFASAADALAERLRSYEAAHEAVQQTRLACFNLQQKAKGYTSKLWIVQSKSEVAKASCGDGAVIAHTYNYQYGHHEPEVAAKLKKTLYRLLKLRTKGLVRMQYEETACRLWIQDHISAFLNEASWAQKTGTSGEASIDSDNNTTGRSKKQDLERIKRSLDVLFQFERSVRRQPDFDIEVEEQKAGSLDMTAQTPPQNIETLEPDPDAESQPNSILRSIRSWIAPLAATLLHHGGYAEYEYLIVQVLKSPGAAKWAAIYVQCNIPSSWSSSFQEYYQRQLRLVFCGRSSLQSRRYSIEDDLAPGATEDLGSKLDEDDYLAILDQMDLPLFFHRLLIEHKAMYSNNGTLLQREISERTTQRLIASTQHIFAVIIYGLRRLIHFNVVSKRISQMLCQLVQIFGDNLILLEPSVSNARSSTLSSPNMIHHNTTTMAVQQEVDLVLTNITKALIALPGHGLWTFIPSIPFKFMSISTAAMILEELALDNISQWIADPMALLSLAPESNKLRQLLGRNPGEAVFLLTALATMVTSRFSSNHGMAPSSLPPMDHNIALVVTFLLLDVAYLDSDIRGELSKPAREILSSLCDSIPSVVSFILRFVEKYFKDMGDMAQYLFRELPLDEWELSSEDFALLKTFLETPPLTSHQSMFARYIFSSLPWDADGDRMDEQQKLRVPQEFRKELALTMADMCIHHLHSSGNDTEALPNVPFKDIAPDSPTSPLRTKTPDIKFAPSFASSLPQAVTHLAAHTGLHRSVERTTLRTFMDWCWKTLVQLDLLEVPLLTLVESSRLHVPDPGLAKYPMFSQGQLTFVNTVHLLLTKARCDSEIFLQEGWSTLTSVLHAGMGEPLLDLTAKLIVGLIVSEKDLDAHAARFGQLLRDIATWKQDPFLAGEGIQLAEKQGPLPSKVPKDLLALWLLLNRHIRGCDSQKEDASVAVLRFWISAMFSQKEWMAHQECVQILDVVCLSCFDLGLDTLIKDLLTEQQILLSIGFRRAPGMSAELMGLAQPGLDKVMDMLPGRFLKALPVPQGSNDPSLLMGIWSVKSFATNLLTQQAMVETNSIFFAYYVLLIETSLERDMRIKIGNYYRQHPADIKSHGNIKTVMKMLGITSRKTLHNFAIWRWAQHLLILPFTTYLLPLFWQEFFYLYFGHVEQRDTFYGYKFLETSPEMVEQLRERLQKTYVYFGQEARKAIQELDSTKAATLTTLHEFYIALYGWISEPLLLTPDIDLKRIRQDLKPDRLMSCRLPDPLDCNADLWRDLLFERVTPAVDSGAASRTTSSPLPAVTRSPPTSNQSNLSPTLLRGRSNDQVRAVRKHSQAWQEQKISNCLVKQSKPGPEFYIPRVLVQSPEFNHKTSAQGLFSQTIRTLRDHAKGYRDTNDAYESLNTSYLTELSALYHNEVKTSRLEIACDTTPNALCKRPAVIELQYEEIVLNEQVRRSIVDNRARAAALRLGHVDQGLYLAALELLKTVDTLVGRLTMIQELDPQTPVLHKIALESFYYLCKELVDDARRYPPVQIILGAIVETLGVEVVAKDPLQTEPILDLMQTDDFMIALLCKTFYPAALPSEFVRLYRRIATCKEYSLVSKDLLLRQFDVQAWACDPTTITAISNNNNNNSSSNTTPVEDDKDSVVSRGSKSLEGPTVQDRLAFYEVAFTAMVAQQQLQRQDTQIQEATELSTRERLAIIKSHRELAGTLFLNFLQQDYVEYLRILFDTCGIMCLEPEVLEDFIRILGVEPRLVPALLDGEDGMDGRLADGQLQSNRSKISTTTLGLSDYDLGCLVQFLADYFNNCQEQMAQGNLLDRYSGYAISIASLLTVVLCEERYLTIWMKPYPTSIAGYTSLQDEGGIEDAYHHHHRQSGLELVNPDQCRMWHDILRVFQPWLSCLTNHAVDELRFQRQQSGASRMLFTFVGIVSKMMSALQMQFRDVSPMLAKVFELWLDMMVQTTVGQGCINQTMLIHQHFRRLDWRGLELSKENVERILQVKAQLNVEIGAEFWTYLVTVVMESADTDLRPRDLKRDFKKGSVEWHQTEATFLRMGLVILQEVDAVAGNDLDTRQQFLDRLWVTIFDAGDWTLLSTSELKPLVEELKVHWDRAGPWDNLSSPMGLLLYWMRIAVGLESTDMNELDSDDGTAPRREHFRNNSNNSSGHSSTHLHDIKRDNRLSVDRVVIYFDYVLRLLQARLASSAEDSQNVNFRMNALPLVVTHLGQVLDRIAGNPFETKHPTIYRSLLALVGTLNQCGRGPSSLSALPSGYQSFDVVFRGLARMISEVSVIQLDVIRAVCQRLNSIPIMINLLEEAIEREFDVWTGQQTSPFFARSASAGEGAMAATATISGSVFGLEDTSMQPVVSAMPMIGHARTLQRHGGGGGGGGGRESWSRIKTQMDAPELSEDEFLNQALAQGAILTIYGRFLQRLEECEQSQEFDEVLELGQELAEVISNMDLMAIEPWKAYQSLLLLRMFLNLVAKESVHSVLQSRFLNSVKQVCRALEPWFQDRDSTKGMLSSIGMGTRSSFDPKFRLVVRIIYTYLVVRLADKNVSIYQGVNSGHAGGSGGVLAWRKGRQSRLSNDSVNRNFQQAGAEARDGSAALIETLSQLPAKNKDYASIFVTLTVAPASSYAVTTTTTTSTATATTTAMTMAMAIPAMASSISMIPSLASSPIELVKKTILPSSPPVASFMRPSSSSPSSSPRSSSAASTPTFVKERRTSHNSGHSSIGVGASNYYNKRMSLQSQHSRFSTGSSWDDTAGSLLLFEGMSEPNGGSSTMAGRSLVATQRRSAAGKEHRVRQQVGTKNGLQDLEWVVQQIKDRRFRILEAAEVLTEVMERFYEGDDYFA
ncbi:Ectopic P granules protein 5 [Mortierella alpina]|nr:Ectopic P granules protein 5 [Mortierella alpina]